MSHINIHPAPGLGDMVPGWFAVPNNPIMDGNSAVGVGYVPHIGELMPAKFGIPENPIIRGLAGCGMGYCSNNNAVGMGGPLDDIWNSITQSVSDAAPQTATWPWYYWAGIVGGAVMLMTMMTPGGSEYRARKRSLIAKQRTERDALRTQYRGTTRLGGRVSAGARAVYAGATAALAK